MCNEKQTRMQKWISRVVLANDYASKQIDDFVWSLLGEEDRGSMIVNGRSVSHPK